jgi:predicted TIM-barrel fold metal-dependent hydrolase
MATDYRADQIEDSIDRRDFLKASALSAAVVPFLSPAIAPVDAGTEKRSLATDSPKVIDTNMHLFEWPFRRLKYSQTSALVAKLRKHRVTEAWAGSFEALLHKNLDEVNRRLTEECRRNSDLPLRPFGSVCPVWPGWDEDLRRCHEIYKMPGIRLYPSFHNYRLDRSEFAELLVAAAARGLVVQIVIEMEDPRVHHPAVNIAAVETAALSTALKMVPHARVQLLNGMAVLQQGGAAELIANTRVVFDISNFEGAGAIGRLLEGKHWSIKPQIPLGRLLFGSHAPFFPYEAALLRLFESPLDREHMAAIMRENALRLATRDRTDEDKK